MILRKDIITDDNPLLRQKSVDVTLPLSKEDEKLLDDMMEYLENSQDEEKSKELFMNFKANIYKNYPEGKTDNTHLRLKGAKEICKILVNEISKIDKIKHIIKR